MPLLRDLMAERGLSEEEVASLLNERGVTIRKGARKGDSISEEDVKRRSGADRIPREWAAALELEMPASAPAGGDGDGGPSSDGLGRRRRDESAPKRPREAPVVIEAGAQKRIAGAYKFAGAALAAGSRSDGVAAVWSDSSDKIAELWIAAAQENPWAARFVNMMSAGGPMGDLAAGHLYLAGATLYVLGAGIPGGDAIFAKYSRYRPVDVRPSANGSEPAAAAPVQPAEGAVVDGSG